MGVPGFFSWILRQYKNNNKIIIPNTHKRLHTLYLDANCLFHPQCFKVIDHIKNWASTDELEDKMFGRILNYIDFLLQKVKPTNRLYISVDGVAPMAKMNQQRKRRFKSIYDIHQTNNIKKKHGKSIDKFWSNSVITPGSEFMEKLHNKLITFSKYIQKKYNITVIYSSYHTPGEGEHKILQDIKQNITDEPIVIYGLDADLIFLSLASGKKDIYLLREVVHFGGEVEEKVITNCVLDVEEDLCYVSIDKFKKFLNIKLNELVHKKDHNADPDDFTYDFIFISYLIGNDFIPHLPSIDMKTQGLDLIINCYIDIYINTQQHILDITENDVIVNSTFLGILLQSISKYERHYFKNILPRYQTKLSKYKFRLDDEYKKDLWDLRYLKCFDIKDPIKLGKGRDDVWKWRYYEYYYGISEYQTSYVKKMCKEYLKGIMWTTYYYFKKCPSWTWQYIYLHGPFISDIADYYANTYNKSTSHSLKKNININDIQFESSSSLVPCTQLLSVLPPASSYILPESYRELVHNIDSPIIYMYPTVFKLDMINKDVHWKCIPHIPPVDINELKKAVCDHKLTKEEEIRNTILPNFIYSV